MRRLTGSAVLAWLAAGAVSAQPLPDNARDCVAELEAGMASGAFAGEELLPAGEVCTAFMAALETSTWSEVLQPSAVWYLNRDRLGATIELAEDYEAAMPAPILTTELATIVAGLEPFVPTEEPSLWQQLVEWVEGLFASESGESNWLTDWLSSLSLSDAASGVIVRVIALAAVVAVVVILLNELRLGGALVRSRPYQRREAAAAPGADMTELDLDTVLATTSVRRRIELMLALVIQRLGPRHPGILHAGRTHRELAAAAAELDSGLREPFTDIVRSAERVTYAGRDPGSEELARVVESGQSIIAGSERGSAS